MRDVLNSEQQSGHNGCRWRRGRGRLLSIACLAAVFAAASFSPASAQQKACGEGQGQGNELKQCVDDILDEQESTIQMLDDIAQELEAMNLLQANSDNPLSEQVQFLREARSRAKNDNQDTMDEDYVSAAVKSRGKSDCSFEERPEFAGEDPNDVCNKDELAANQCIEVCDFDADAKGRNKNQAKRFENGLADALEQTTTANAMLAGEVAELTALSATGFTLNASEACTADFSFLGSTPISTEALFGVFVASKALEAVRDISERGCDQTVLGANAAAACAAVEAAFWISEKAFEIMEFINADIAGAEAAATFQCVGEIQSKVQELGEEIQEIKEMVIVIDQLLRTPQGRRPDFPLSTSGSTSASSASK